MRNGYIEFWHSDRGYGFIEAENEDGTKARFFVHISAIVSGLPVSGAFVVFDEGRTSKGQWAVNVSVVPSWTVAVNS